MKTEITKLLGIEYPIIQGGMAWVAEYHLAAAVSEAGGLGLIGAASALPEWVARADQRSEETHRQTIWCEYYAYESECGRGGKDYCRGRSPCCDDGGRKS